MNIAVNARDAMPENGTLTIGLGNVEVVEAERQVLAAPGSFGLLFADVALGDGNGFDLAGRVRALAPGIRVLLTSGYTDDTSQLMKIRAAGVPFLAKPYALSALLITIHDVLRKPLAAADGPFSAAC